MCSSPLGAAYGCAMFSVVGIGFMSWVGYLLMKQPFLIAGIEDVESAKSSAFGAAGTFFFSFLACVTFMAKESRHQLPPIESAARYGGLTSLSSSPARRMSGEYGEYGGSGSGGGGYRDYPDEEEHAIQELPGNLTRRTASTASFT